METPDGSEADPKWFMVEVTFDRGYKDGPRKSYYIMSEREMKHLQDDLRAFKENPGRAAESGTYAVASSGDCTLSISGRVTHAFVETSITGIRQLDNYQPAHDYPTVEAGVNQHRRPRL